MAPLALIARRLHVEAMSRLGGRRAIVLVRHRARGVEGRWTLAGGPDGEVELRELRVGDAAAGERGRTWLVATFPAPLDPGRLGRCVLRRGARRLRFAGAPSNLLPPEAFARRWLADAAPEVWPPLCSLLLGPGAAAAADELEVADDLFVMRQACRPPLEPGDIALETPSAVRLETVLAVDARSHWLTGWLRDPDPAAARLTAVAPEGPRLALRDLPLYPRAGVDAAFGGPGGAGAPCNRGFEAYVTLGHRSRRPGGWAVEKASAAAGPAAATSARPACWDPATALEHVSRLFGRSDAGGGEALFPAVEGVYRRLAREVSAGEVLTLGPSRETAGVSIVVVLDEDLDLLEQQVAQLAADRTAAEAELVCVVPPGPSASARALAGQLQQLYGCAIRLVALSHPVGWGAAANLGAAHSSGSLLVLLGRSVLPARSGWLDALVASHAAAADAGLVGAELLDAAGRSASAGIPGCFLLPVETHRAHGGFDAGYVGDAAATDLCMRLRAAGLVCPTSPRAQAFRLEGHAPGAGAAAAGRYDAWLLGRRSAGRGSGEAG